MLPMAVSVLSLLPLSPIASPVNAATMSDRIIAVVNTELIMWSELKTEIAEDLKRVQEKYRGAELQRRAQQAEYVGLTRMIERTLQMQLAKSKGIEVGEEEIRRTIQEIQRQGDKIDENDPVEKKKLEEQLTLMKVVDREVRSTIMITEQELKKYYDAHVGRFLLPDEYRISQILLIPKGGESQEETRRRVKQVYDELQQGGDFAQLAFKYSNEANIGKGGSLGFVRQGELHAPIERALSGLEPDHITEPIETAQGFHIIRLDEKRVPQTRPFAEVKTEIQSLVYQQKSEDFYQTWITDLKNKSYIEIKF